MNIIDNDIINKIRDISESDKRLTYLTGAEKTKESYRNGNLHLELRKLTTIANKENNVFYCSRCGLKFNSPKQRMIHVEQDH